ncbi:MAG: phosphate--acyl-ACP acyltransferase, partial [Bacteroidales bacterium]
MKIGLDVMGGDYAPGAIVEGAVDSLEHLSDADELVLIGDEPSILKKTEELKIKPSCFRIVHTSQVIGMGDIPAKAYAQKQDSSIAVGYRMLKEGKIDGFCSAGNTGA